MPILVKVIVVTLLSIVNGYFRHEIFKSARVIR